jgi:hypothetical protein
MKLSSARHPQAVYLRPAAATALVLVTAILSGCGASPKGPTTAAPASPGPTSKPAKSSAGSPTDATNPPAAASSPCSLLTGADIGTVTGLPMTVSGTDGSVTCVYLSADKTQQFSVQILANRAAMVTLLQLEAGSVHLSGLGDDAFWSGAGILFVRVGDRAFSLSSQSIALSGDAAKAGMTLLATHALAKF